MSREQALSEMNAALCQFGGRWKLDGDYLRCADCERPHIASRLDLPFRHSDDCAYEDANANPWRLFMQILEPLAALTREAAPQASGGDAHAWAVKYDADTFLAMQPMDVSRDFIAGWNTCRAHVMAQKYIATPDSAIQSQQGATGGAVDDAMVDRACLAYEVEMEGCVYGPEAPETAMRSALNAAIAQPRSKATAA